MGKEYPPLTLEWTKRGQKLFLSMKLPSPHLCMLSVVTSSHCCLPTLILLDGCLFLLYLLVFILSQVWPETMSGDSPSKAQEILKRFMPEEHTIEKTVKVSSPLNLPVTGTDKWTEELLAQEPEEENNFVVIDRVQIELLKQKFEEQDEGDDGGLDLEQFVAAFGEVLGKAKNPRQLEHMFMKIDANSDGSVDWDEFTNFLLMASHDDVSGGTTAMDLSHYFVKRKVRHKKKVAKQYLDVHHTAAKNSSHRFKDKDASSHDSLTEKKPNPLDAISLQSIVPGLKSVRANVLHSGHHALGASSSSSASSATTVNQFGLIQEKKDATQNETFRVLIEALCYVPKFNHYVTGTREGALMVWSPSMLTVLKVVTAAGSWINALAYLPASNRLAVCSLDRVVTFYEPNHIPSTR